MPAGPFQNSTTLTASPKNDTGSIFSRLRRSVQLNNNFQTIQDFFRILHLSPAESKLRFVSLGIRFASLLADLIQHFHRSIIMWIEVYSLAESQFRLHSLTILMQGAGEIVVGIFVI